MTASPYASAARGIKAAGYNPLPIAHATKSGNIPGGFTGYDGADVTDEDVDRWCKTRPSDNIAARLPRHVVGLDVDAYEDKAGAQTLTDLEARLGRLPHTWRVSSRFDDDYDGVSGILLFQLPAPYAAKADDPKAGWRGGWPGIDLIRFGHRFVMAPPSIHDKRGTPYLVMCGATGVISDDLPDVDHLPFLPEAWCKALLQGEEGRERSDAAPSQYWTEGKPCSAVNAALGQTLQELEVGRHDNALAGVLRLTRLGEQGHLGVCRAVDTLCGAFASSVIQPGDGQRSPDDARAEWQRMVDGIDDRVRDGGLTASDDRGCCPAFADPSGGGEGGDWTALELERALSNEVRRLWILREAKARLAREGEGKVESFDAGLLSDVLGRPSTRSWRVEGLHPAGGSLLLVAQRKAGKTTLALNLARSLITGEPFLGSYDTDMVDGTVAFLNYEVSARQLASWADEVGIPGDRLLLVNLRGRRNPLVRDEDRDLLTALLREHDAQILMVDPFARAFTGENSNDAGQVTSFTSDLDRLAHNAGCTEIVLTNHTGWNKERGRNSSALEDWADSIVTVVKDEHSSARYLRAEGRDVDIEEDRLAFDSDTRLLTMSGRGNRQSVVTAERERDHEAAIVDIITAEPGLGSRQLDDALRTAGFHPQTGDGAKAAKVAAASGAIFVKQEGRKKAHYPQVSYVSQQDPNESNDVSPRPYKGRDTSMTGQSGPCVTHRSTQGGDAHTLPLPPANQEAPVRRSPSPSQRLGGSA